MHFPCLKAFSIDPEGRLQSLHARAPWALRKYERFKWNRDPRGIWVYPFTPTNIHSIIIGSAAWPLPWEVWFCLGSGPLHPKDSVQALFPESPEPNWDNLPTCKSEVAFNRLKPEIMVLSSDRANIRNTKAMETLFWENLRWSFWTNRNYV